MSSPSQSITPVLRQRSLAWLLTLPVIAPLLLLFASWNDPQPEVWLHLREHVLGAVIGNTLGLLAGLALITSVLGIGLAWLTARCEFPGRRWLEWALVMPLAVPGYVAAFAYVGMFDYAGPVQSGWRWLSGTREALPEVRSVPGAALVLGLVLYPYVYLLVRAAFLRQGAAAFDAARSLGLGPWSSFWRVALPLARPAWLAGLTLVLLEALADFGAVSILGVDTFTTAIYKTWFSLYSLAAASQLASLLLLVVVLVLSLGAALRGPAQQHQRSTTRMPRIRLRGARAVGASAAALVVVMLGFGLPLARLLGWAHGGQPSIATLLHDAGNTLLLGVAVAVSVVALGLCLAMLERRRPQDPWVRAPVFLANLGYAVPGTVLAVATMLALLWLERGAQQHFGWSLALSSSVLATIAALTLRFLRVGHASVDAGLRMLGHGMIESAQVLGVSPWQRLRRIVLPMLRPSLAGALLLAGVETMKELPATLMLRPFGWDTLAVRIYSYTSEGLWQQAAWPALLLIAVGLLPVRWLVRAQD